MFGKIFRKKRKEPEVTTMASGIKGRTKKLFGFLGEKLAQAHEEIATIREKSKNLLETNYKLGMKHIDNGNIKEATFRFRFIKKVWPDYLESYYQLGYCLILQNKFDEAKQILEELIEKDPDYTNDANELLEIIKTAKENNND